MQQGELTVLASAVALTGTLTDLPTSARITLNGAARLSLWLRYTRAGGSSSGLPVIRVEGSAETVRRDPAAITLWTPYPAVNLGSYSDGRLTANPLEIAFGPSAAGVSLHRLPDLDVADLNFVRVRVMDVDGTTPGTLTLSYRLVSP